MYKISEDWDGKAQPRIVCAACRHDDIIIVGPRHWDNTMHRTSLVMGIDAKSSWDFEQGFIDQFGDFYDRKESMVIAKAAGQEIDIERGCGGDDEELYSEGLY